MGRPPNVIPRVVVEDCEIVKASDALACLRLGLRFTTVATRGRGQRLCLLCPVCSRRAFKLYRPMYLQAFACRACHNLSYTSVQKHDVRLDRLLKLSQQSKRVRSSDAHNANSCSGGTHESPAEDFPLAWLRSLLAFKSVSAVGIDYKRRA
jgi:hypothetical protein